MQLDCSSHNEQLCLCVQEKERESGSETNNGEKVANGSIGNHPTGSGMSCLFSL
jgi:hypothetical protein